MTVITVINGLPLIASAYSLEQLATLASVPRRTVRYYIQIGLMEGPDGETRAATYGKRHLERLLEIRRLQDKGYSLDQIRAAKKGERSGQAPLPPPAEPDVLVEVWTRITLAEGIELQIEPARAGLGPGQVRELVRRTRHIFESLKKENEA